MLEPVYLVIVFVICFLLGSIPFGLIISKLFYHTDIRETGSGNIGTTNAMRSLGKVGGVSVFILDFGKGVASGLLAVAIAQWAIGAPEATIGYFTVKDSLAVSFLGCVTGHVFSPWLGFHGGKGIAVAVGCLFTAFGFVGAWLELGIFIILVITTKRVSIGSIAAAATCPLFALYFYWGHWFAWAVITIAAIIVVWAHRENIARLRAGTESRIGDKKKEDQ